MKGSQKLEVKQGQDLEIRRIYKQGKLGVALGYSYEEGKNGANGYRN